MGYSPERRPRLVGRIAERARRLVGRNTEQDPARKAAKKIFKDCGERASYIKDSFGEAYDKPIPNFYLSILLGTALSEAVFNCFYRDEDTEDPPGITRIPLAKGVLLETDRLFEEKRLKMYDTVLSNIRNYKKCKPDATLTLISFYQTEVLPKAKLITVDYKAMGDMKENGITEKLALAVDNSIGLLSQLPDAKELGI